MNDSKKFSNYFSILGDIKKKGMPDPYAYIPLTRNTLNRRWIFHNSCIDCHYFLIVNLILPLKHFRKKKKSAGQFKSIVRSAKKGAATGNKNFKSKNRSKKWWANKWIKLIFHLLNIRCFCFKVNFIYFLLIFLFHTIVKGFYLLEENWIKII